MSIFFGCWLVWYCHNVGVAVLMIELPVYEHAGNNVAPGQFEANVWPPVCADPSREEAAAHHRS